MVRHVKGPAGTCSGSTRGRVWFRRLDTSAAVEVACDPVAVPPAPEMSPLMVAALGGRATPAEQHRFAELWQARVREILSGDLARVVRTAEVARAVLPAILSSELSSTLQRFTRGTPSPRPVRT